MVTEEFHPGERCQKRETTPVMSATARVEGEGGN